MASERVDRLARFEAQMQLENNMFAMERGKESKAKQDKIWKQCFETPFNWHRYTVVDKQLKVEIKLGIISTVEDSFVKVKDEISGEMDTFGIDAAKKLVYPGHRIQDNHGAPARIVCLKNIPNDGLRALCTTKKYGDMIVQMPFDYEDNVDSPNNLIKCAQDIISSSGYDEDTQPLTIGETFIFIPNWIDRSQETWDITLEQNARLMKWEIVAENDESYFFKYQHLQYTRYSWSPEIVTNFFEIHKVSDESYFEPCMEKFQYLKHLKSTWDDEEHVEVQDVGKVGKEWHDEFLREHIYREHRVRVN